VLIKTKLYPNEIPSTNLDFDWLYRKLLPNIVWTLGHKIVEADRSIRRYLLGTLGWLLGQVERWSGMNSGFAKTATISSMAFFALSFLAVFLVLYFIKE
jgi:multicomponent Na+:H+ antiporter subunit D